MKRKTAVIVWALATLLGAGHAYSEPCTESIPDLFERVSPAVVTITAITVDPYNLQERVQTVIGSGFVIDAKGLVLTNAHVVFGRKAIMATLDDGVVVPADLVGADPILDVAVLKLEGEGIGFSTVAVIEDSASIRVGEEVIAIGNPMGLEQTVTRGIVSGINRILPVAPMSFRVPMIQTDAAINPGNSGGPLLNRCGQVIGMTTSVLDSAENIGFALPAGVIRGVLPALIRDGRVIRPWLGLRGQLIEKDEIQALFNIDVVDGFLVESVDPGSPSEKAGLRGGFLPVSVGNQDFLFGGDIVVSFNGQALKEPENYEKVAKTLRVGDKVRLTIFRDGATQKVEFVLPERPLLPGDLPGSNSSLIQESARP
jgi:S1-C subfamily serine protease